MSKVIVACLLLSWAYAAPEDELAKETTKDLEVKEASAIRTPTSDTQQQVNFNKSAPSEKEDTAKELQDHAAKTQDTLVDAVENAEVAEIKRERAVVRPSTRHHRQMRRAVVDGPGSVHEVFKQSEPNRRKDASPRGSLISAVVDSSGAVRTDIENSNQDDAEAEEDDEIGDADDSDEESKSGECSRRRRGGDCATRRREPPTPAPTPAPVDCEWDEWDEWSACSAECGGGERTRERAINTEAAHGGEECDGDDKEEEECNTNACIAVVKSAAASKPYSFVSVTMFIFIVWALQVLCNADVSPSADITSDENRQRPPEGFVQHQSKSLTPSQGSIHKLSMRTTMLTI